MEVNATDRFSADPSHGLRREASRRAVETRESSRPAGDRVEISREAERRLSEEESRERADAE